MKKKQQKIQIALISIGLLLIISTYFYYPLMKKAELAKGQLQQRELRKNTTHDETTFFEDVDWYITFNFSVLICIPSIPSKNLFLDQRLLKMIFVE